MTAITSLKDYYDGYHFTWPSPDIYNPFSLLNAFASKKLKPFWFESGTPTYLLEMLRKFNMTPTMINKVETRASEFDAPIEHKTHVIPLLYQSGYITITDYDPEFQSYTLDIPNKELYSILPYPQYFIYYQYSAGHSTCPLQERFGWSTEFAAHVFVHNTLLREYRL